MSKKYNNNDRNHLSQSIYQKPNQTCQKRIVRSNFPNICFPCPHSQKKKAFGKTLAYTAHNTQHHRQKRKKNCEGFLFPDQSQILAKKSIFVKFVIILDSIFLSFFFFFIVLFFLSSLHSISFSIINSFL